MVGVGEKKGRAGAKVTFNSLTKKHARFRKRQHFNKKKQKKSIENVRLSIFFDRLFII